MRKLYTVLVCLVFASSITLILPQQMYGQKSQQIILAGYNHKPPVSTPGSGMATINLKGDSLKVQGDFDNLTSPFSGAYLMVNLKGQPGNQLYRLKTKLNEEKTGGTLNAEENSFELTPAEKKLLQEGDLYINISSTENRKGELRGDIGPMGK
jgi:hypothetical protein